MSERARGSLAAGGGIIPRPFDKGEFFSVVDWERIYQAIPEAAALVDTGYRFIWVNRAMEDLLGLPREQILGASCYALLHGFDAPLSTCPFSMPSEEFRREASEIAIPGRDRFVRVVADPVYDMGGRLCGAFHILTDITAEKKAEEANLLASRRLELLHRIGTAVLKEQDLDTILAEATRDVCRFLGIPRSVVRLYGDPDKVIEHAEPGFSPAGADFCVFRCEGDSGAIRGEGRNVVVDDIRQYPSFAERRGEIERVRLGSFIGIPLRVQQEPIGVFFVAGEAPHGWTENEVATAEAVAGQLAIAARHARVFRDQQELAGRLVSLVNNVPGIVYRGLRDWSVTFMGADVRRLTGHAAEAFLSRSVDWRDLIHPDDVDAVRSAFREAVRIGRRVLRVEYRVRHKDGRYRWLEDRRQLIYGGDGSFAYVDGLLLDITENKLIEESLRESEHRFRAIADTATDAIVTVDSHGTVVFFNPSAERMFGHTADEIAGKEVLAIIPPRFRAAHIRGMERVAASGETRIVGKTVELAGLRKDGTEFPVELSLAAWQAGGRTFYTGIVRDITGRKKAEVEARRASETFRGVIQASPLAICGLDLDGNVTMWNQAAEHIFGWTEREALHRPLPIVPDEKRDESRALLDMGRRGRALSGVELHRRRKDGSPIDVSVWTSPLQDGEGNVTGVMSVYADVTERRQIEDALRQSEEQLRQSQKMEAIGRLAGGVAHDFNNLLTAIRGYSELLFRKLEPRSPMRRDVLEIQKAGERAESLTRQLLAFSRKQTLQPRILDLNAVVANLDKMLRRLIGEDIDLATALAPGLGNVRVDPGQIEQVIMNLAVNARDAMPKGGKVTIETANVELGASSTRRYPGTQPGPFVMLAVSDTGEGMDEATKNRLFEPFFTTKEMGKGTGLGLSTVYGIVKQSGGYIWVYSEPGRGTNFKIYLPRVAGVAEETSASEPSGPAPTGRETVLLVEDERIVRRLVRDILEMGGYTVLEACDGSQALRIVEGLRAPLDLVVTDVVMPKMGGRELAELLARRTGTVKVLYMSGYTDEAIVHHGVLDPGIPFLQKPFTPDALLRKVREVLDTPGAS